ncbi:hypothetical protein CK556_01815 [Mesoplasma chauliocola]|uniref:Lipolytic enzyme, GDSL family n=1 Tax=Mesoplasma chauliocola TaxID=216427 RepID=A0A249SNM8_9MOLU|nr:SGNH/GDSL hydrolase family protein [Mesoplasma chauliocola]ASZ09091.1 hypothetical protein CK556_01815 [Mesoplasma chauliocola]
MKKLLSLLAMTALITPIVANVVSCGENEGSVNTNPLLIGKNIDKSKAIDDSMPGKFGLTNYYVVGDSLSDVDGITHLIDTKFSSQYLSLNVELGGAYGYTTEEGKHYNTFTNGPTAGSLLSEKLDFGEMKPSNWLSKKSEQNYGKNYSVGGATAAKIDLPTGLLLNDATVDKQTEALISQHEIKNNDLVFFEIGGNDLFSLISFYGNEAKQVEFMNDSIYRIRTAFFNLLNNGVKNIIFMTPPRMDFVPRYQSVFEEAKSGNVSAQQHADFILAICDEYYNKVINVLEEIEQYYPNQIKLYDMYKKADELEAEFDEHVLKTTGKNSVKRKSYSNTLNFEVELNGIKQNFEGYLNLDLLTNVKNIANQFKTDIEFGKQNILNVKVMPTRDNEVTDEINNYFFTDIVHPTKKVHEMVSDILLEYAQEMSNLWKN